MSRSRMQGNQPTPWTPEQVQSILEEMANREYNFQVGPGFVEVTVRNRLVHELQPTKVVIPFLHFCKVAAVALADQSTVITQNVQQVAAPNGQRS